MGKLFAFHYFEAAMITIFWGVLNTSNVVDG